MKVIYILYFCILFFSVRNASATHAIGSEITYRCLGQGSSPGTYEYEITFTFYRDCSGINVSPFTGEINISNTCGFPLQSVILNPTLNSPIQISPTCPGVQSTCNGGQYSGVEQWIYRGNVTLPGECNQWTFAHSESARSPVITTVSGIGSENLYVYATVNNENGLCNNSPTFLNEPIQFSCVNQRFCFSQGDYDAEGDSLVYELITPRTGPNIGDTVDYITGYSKDQPLISFPPMTFDHSTGSFCANVTQGDVTVMAVLVNEFRNGVLIGQVERDIQITVLFCSNNLPVIGGFNCQPSITKRVCTNMVNCFNICSFDPDTGNNTTITWDNSIPNVSFTTTGGHRDSALICWSPVAADTAGNPHCFTITVTDDNCPYMGLQIFSYCFIVEDTSGCSTISIDEFDLNQPAFRVYPQPATDELFFDFGPDFIANGFKKFSIEDVIGQGVYRSSINRQIVSMNTTHRMIPGIYFVRIINETGKTIAVKKIIVSG